MFLQFCRLFQNYIYHLLENHWLQSDKQLNCWQKSAAARYENRQYESWRWLKQSIRWHVHDFTLIVSFIKSLKKYFYIPRSTRHWLLKKHSVKILTALNTSMLCFTQSKHQYYIQKSDIVRNLKVLDRTNWKNTSKHLYLYNELLHKVTCRNWQFREHLKVNSWINSH